MPAFPRQSDDPKVQAQYDEDARLEAESWAKAFGDAKPDPLAGPFTPEENEQLVALMFAAAEEGDQDTLAMLKELSKDPAAYRRAVADFKPDAE